MSLGNNQFELHLTPEPQNQNTITSLKLVEQVNFFRLKVESKKPIRHDTLLNVIRDEFEEEIGVQKLLETPYVNNQNGQTYSIFNLSLSQAKQVLARESKHVRKAVIQYIEELENKAQKVQPQPIELSRMDILKLALESEEARLATEKQLQLANTQLQHKQEIILDLTADIPPKEMRATINEVIRWKAGDYGGRWNKLYKQFKYYYSVDIPTRAEHRDMKKLDYAQQNNLLTDLYKLALELFEKDNPETKNQLATI
jgi:hypothetical protein